PGTKIGSRRRNASAAGRVPGLERCGLKRRSVATKACPARSLRKGARRHPASHPRRRYPMAQRKQAAGARRGRRRKEELHANAGEQAMDETMRSGESALREAAHAGEKPMRGARRTATESTSAMAGAAESAAESSEERTSELQSRENLGCRLLL